MKIVLKDPPTYLIVGKKKPKKIYFTQNSLNSRNHFINVDKVLDYAKSVIRDAFDEQYKDAKPIIEPNSIALIIIKTKKKVSKNVNFDIDNKGNFWAKVFLDLVQHPTTKKNRKGKMITRNPTGLSLLLNDNVYWIRVIVEMYQPAEVEEIDLIISNDIKISIPSELI